MDGFLSLAFLFLIAGLIAVPIASRLGLGSVLGYLIAGIAIAPVLERFGVDVVGIQHFAEFGVVMMLFLVGLELEPRMLWAMRNRLLGLGGLQVGLTTLIVMGIAMAMGQAWSVALAVGMVLALSSTAIVLQTLQEKGLLRSEGGEATFSVLLFQDIAVIPMLAFLPLLALPELAGGLHGGDGGHGSGAGLVAGLSGWQQGLVTVAAIVAVVIIGSVLSRPMFRFIARAKLRELFTAVALAIVVGIALLMTVVGLSPALGTFLAGVVLANSEYRHQLETDLDPFKGLLLGLFFITVGASINFGLLFSELGLILAMTFGMIAIKAGVLALLARPFGVRGLDRWLFSLGLAQAGEFGFVLLAFTVANGVLPPPLAERLLLVVALSMLLTPVLFIVYDRIICPRYADAQTRAPDEIDEPGKIIVAGVGRFGGIINQILLAAGHRTVVLDHHSEHLDRLRVFGIKVFFGDATRPDMLHAAGIDDARLLVVAVDDREQSARLVRHVAENHPKVHIVARAVDRHHVYELYQAGAQDIIRDTFDSAVRAARSAMEALGVHPYDAERQTKGFVENDRAALKELAELYDPDVPVHENRAYVERTREFMDGQEAAMRGGSATFGARSTRGWIPPTLDDVEAAEEENAAS